MRALPSDLPRRGRSSLSGLHYTVGVDMALSGGVELHLMILGARLFPSSQPQASPSRPLCRFSGSQGLFRVWGLGKNQPRTSCT